MNKIRFAIATLVLSTAACGLVSVDFTGTVNVPFDVIADDSRFEGIVNANLADNEDYRDNKDSIKGGRLIAIEAEIVEIYADNMATAGNGYLYAAKAGDPLMDDGPERSLAHFDERELFVGQIIPFDMTDEQKAYIGELLFPADGGDANIDVLVRVDSNGTPAFKARLNVDVEFSAGL